jgi:hypothetical protein
MDLYSLLSVDYSLSLSIFSFLLKSTQTFYKSWLFSPSVYLAVCNDFYELWQLYWIIYSDLYGFPIKFNCFWSSFSLSLWSNSFLLFCYLFWLWLDYNSWSNDYDRTSKYLDDFCGWWDYFFFMIHELRTVDIFDSSSISVLHSAFDSIN